MKCSKVQEALWAGVKVDGMDEHLRECKACQSEADMIDGFTNSLAKLSVPQASRHLLPNSAVITKTVRRNRRARGRKLSMFAVSLAGAAGVCIAAGLTLKGAFQSAAPTLTQASYPHSGMVTIETYKAKTFTANVMLVKDPTKVEVRATKYLGRNGETVPELIRDAHGIGGVNGGAFYLGTNQGQAGIPAGITISNGKEIGHAPSTEVAKEVALTASGKLLYGDYTYRQLQALHVTQAVSFTPILVKDGKSTVNGDGGWGYGLRTAIGQRADGTIIFVVTDGRGQHGWNDMGASLKDLSNLMIHYGAVTAANLDGGSSSVMYYHNKLVGSLPPLLMTGVGHRVATAFVVVDK